MLNILISNDDGVHAPGINTLYNALKDIANVVVIAPLQERSTTGHTLTLDHPLRVQKIADNIYGCSGFPADCTLLGLAHLLKNKPDLVISGINRGANLGQDTYYSGTVAAAREASFRGVPAISVSTDIDYAIVHKDDIHFESAAKYIKHLVLGNIHQLIPNMSVLNINVPDLAWNEIKGHAVGELGHRVYSEEVKERRDFKDREYFWIGGVYKGHDNNPLSDCNIVDESKISISLLNLLQKPTETVFKTDLIDRVFEKGLGSFENS